MASSSEGLPQSEVQAWKWPYIKNGLTHIALQAIAKNKIEMCFKDVKIDLQGIISRTENVQCRCTV